MGVVALTVAILPGLLLLAMGLRGRRRGETPFCGRCGYNLTGRASDVCPECGSDLSAAGAVVHGTAHRRRGLIVAGGVLLAVAAVFVVAVLADVDWYWLRPTAWVIRDTQTPNWSDAVRAWRELDRRNKAGRLTDAHYGSSSMPTSSSRRGHPTSGMHRGANSTSTFRVDATKACSPRHSGVSSFSR